MGKPGADQQIRRLVSDCYPRLCIYLAPVLRSRAEAERRALQVLLYALRREASRLCPGLLFRLYAGADRMRFATWPEAVPADRLWRMLEAEMIFHFQEIRSRLPAHFHSLFLLDQILGMSCSEISDATGLAPGSIHRQQTMLKTLLDRYCPVPEPRGKEGAPEEVITRYSVLAVRLVLGNLTALQREKLDEWLGADQDRKQQFAACISGERITALLAWMGELDIDGVIEQILTAYGREQRSRRYARAVLIATLILLALALAAIWYKTGIR